MMYECHVNPKQFQEENKCFLISPMLDTYNNILKVNYIFSFSPKDIFSCSINMSIIYYVHSLATNNIQKKIRFFTIYANNKYLGLSSFPIQNNIIWYYSQLLLPPNRLSDFPIIIKHR